MSQTRKATRQEAEKIRERQNAGCEQGFEEENGGKQASNA
jgi:hypothetical protein